MLEITFFDVGIIEREMNTWIIKVFIKVEIDLELKSHISLNV